MKTKTKKAATKARPTYAEVTKRLDNLRRKVRLLRKTLAGEAADFEFLNLCEVGGADSPEVRRIKAGALYRCVYGLDYLLGGEG